MDMMKAFIFQIVGLPIMNVIGTISTVRDILLQINGLSFSIMKVSIGIILQVTVKWSPING